MKNKNWKIRTGIIILIVSFSTTPMILATPFLGFPVKTKALIITILVIIGNITFYSGGFLVGKELFERYKSRMNPRNWLSSKYFKRLKGCRSGKSSTPSDTNKS